MRRYLVFLIFLGLLLSSGCTDIILSQGSLSLQSDPEAAEVYLDSEYQGRTPCIVTSVHAGPHMLELRHPEYPVWDKEISVEAGKTLNITADLSENIVPEITVQCEGDCTYAMGDAITVSGRAVSARPEVNITITALDDDLSDDPRVYTTRADADYNYELRIPTEGLLNGRYRLVASLPGGESESVMITIEDESETNIRILQGIVEDYHETHTYSIYDLFVCSDMAVDVWNMVETAGINAILVAGNTDDRYVSWEEYDHAWVLAETSPDDWTALETTGGYLVTDNKNYYQGHFFENPRDFKEYISLRERYNDQGQKILSLSEDYNVKLSDYNAEKDYLDSLIDDYNNRYAGQSLTPDEYRAALILKNRIETQSIVVAGFSEEVNRLAGSLDYEEEELRDIEARIMDLVRKGERL